MAASESQGGIVLELAEEFLARYRQGERPPLREYIDRHPELAAEIREVFPAMAMMENIALAEESLAGVPTGAEVSRAAAPLEQLGDYRIIREIGRGGMGIVYEAEQISLGRHVALKVLPAHTLLDGRQLGRFQREARAAARLHHTNIVPVHGAGEHDGLHYIVMQYIPGLALHEVLRELRRFRQPDTVPAQEAPSQGGLSAAAVAQSLLVGQASASGGCQPPDFREKEKNQGAHTPRSPVHAPRSPDVSSSVHLPGQSGPSTLGESERTYWQSVARIGLQVADALGYATSQGILHRDIKPSNLLLDTRATVWITDFGLAKAAEDQDNLTLTGDIVGTLRYMAPERFSGQGDARSDLYSLGLTLYELATFRPAFDETNKNKLIHQILNDDPPRPRRFNVKVPLDLETIILKACARDPAHRYQSAPELAEDLTRFIEDKPIRARRISETERLWRWCRRNPAVALLATLLVLSLVVGIVATSWKWLEAENQRQAAVQEKRDAIEARHDAETARNEAFEARHTAQRQAAELLLDRGQTLAEQGDVGQGLHWMLHSLKTMPRDADDLRHVVRANLAAWDGRLHSLERVLPHPDHVDAVAFSPDGRMFVTGCSDGGTRRFDAATGQPLGEPMRQPGSIHDVAFSPGGKIILTSNYAGRNVSPQERYRVQRWDAATGQPVGQPLLLAGEVWSVTFSPDGTTILTGSSAEASSRGEARLWNAATGEPIGLPLKHAAPVGCVCFSPDGDTFLTGTRSIGPRPEGEVQLWRARDRTRIWEFAQKQLSVRAPRFSPDGQSIWTQEHDQVRRLDARTGAPIGEPLRLPDLAESLELTPDGRTMAVGCSNGTIRLWDLATAQPIDRPLRHQEYVRALAFSPDGRWLVSGSNDGTARLWKIGSVLPPAGTTAFSSKFRPARLPLPFNQVAYHPHRAMALTGGGFWFGHKNIKQACLWDTRTGRPQGAVLNHADIIRAIAFSPDGQRVATGGHDSTARIWDAATGQPLSPLLRHINFVAALAFSPDGKILAAGDYGPKGRVILWDTSTAKPKGPPLVHDDIILSLAFSPDGKRLAAGTANEWAHDPKIILWDLATGQPLGQPMRHESHVHFLAFSPDGRRLLSASTDQTVRLWDAATGQQIGAPLPHNLGFRAFVFSPDGTTFLTGSGDGTALLYDAATGRPRFGKTLVHPHPVTALAFSPDGRLVLVGCEDGSARLWDVATTKAVGPPYRQMRKLIGVAFSLDGRSVLSTANDGCTRRWPVPVPVEENLSRLTLHVQVRTALEMDAGTAVVQLDARTWLERRDRLRALGGTPEEALGPPSSDMVWHDAWAHAAEQTGNDFAALWHWRRLSALQPEDWLFHARRAQVHSNAGRLDQADVDYMLALWHGLPAALVDWYRHRAVACEAAGKEATALWYLNRAIVLSKADADLFVHRAGLHVRKGKLDAGLADWTAALKLRPQEALWYAERAEVYGRLGKPAEQEADQAQAVATGIMLNYIWDVAEERARSGRWAVAADFFAQAQEASPLIYLYCWQRGLALLKAGETAEYRRLCARLMDANGAKPLDHPIAALLARIVTRAPDAVADWTLPLALAEQLAAAAPRLPADQAKKRREWHQLAGAVCYRAGRYDQALRHLSADKEEPSDVTTWLFLAMVHHRLGHAVEAGRSLAKAQAQPIPKGPEMVWETAENELLRSEAETLMEPQRQREGK